MRSQNQQHAAHIPDGRVDVPGLLYGSVGLALSFALHWVGLFKRADAWLFDLLHKPLFQEGVPDLPSASLLLVCSAVFCYGVAFAVLDSPELWRRVVLGVTAIVLTLAMIPAFAVWNVYFSPFVQLVGVFWSWFCVVIYTQHHQMPCDQVHIDIQITAPEPELLQPIEQPIAEPMGVDHPHEIIELPEPPEEKYKPKSEHVEKNNANVSKDSVVSKKTAKKSAKSVKRKRNRSSKKQKRR